MDNNIFNEIGTTLDLNGPILSYSSDPTGATGIGTTQGATGGASISFTGIATGVNPGTGYLSYQWYEQGVGKLSDTTYLTGTASTGPVGTAATLTLSNLITPTDNQRKFYLQVDYVASAYQQAQSGIAASTGNAWNEPLNSGIATATVTPLIEIVSQPPSGVQQLINENSTISIDAGLTDDYFADDLVYQWYLNGEVATDGVKTVTTITGETTYGVVEEAFRYYGNGEFDTHTTPGNVTTDVEIVVAGGAGGGGGHDGGGNGGRGGWGRAGRFFMPATLGKSAKFNFHSGGRGNGGTSGGHNAFGRGGGIHGQNTDGGDGGGAGQHGWSGGGGGGGAGSVVSYEKAGVADDGVALIVAGGGGGGGGGSHHVHGEDGKHAGTIFNDYDSPYPRGFGGRGQTKNGDGGGGGGGGGGVSGGSGGRSGQDRGNQSAGGGGGTNGYRDDLSTEVTSWWNRGDGWGNIKYTATTSQEIITTTNTTLSGTDSKVLTIKADTVGVQTAQCKITSATASNSPMWTDVVNFVATSTAVDNNIIVEAIGSGSTASISSINLNNGDYQFSATQSEASSGQITKYYSVYSPDKDIPIEMDLYGGKGDDNSGTGGEGGYSRIRFTLKQNQEYVIAGLSTALNTPFVYRQAALIACVGKGGAGGINGTTGGDGGGIGVSGREGRGTHRDGGGAQRVGDGTLGENGTFGSSYPALTLYPGDIQATSTLGGKTIRCTKGVYWAQQGVAPCTDISGSTQFRLSDGTTVTNTASITRGYKAGYNIIETAGAGSNNGGDGGNGATGGNGSDAGGGGGGGSGYQDGSVTVVDTRLGGSESNAKVIIRIVV